MRVAFPHAIPNALDYRALIERARFRKVWLRDLRDSKAWDDMGALKRELRDELLRERNVFAKRVLEDEGE